MKTDNIRPCVVEGCRNLGETKGVRRNKNRPDRMIRRKYCATHRAKGPTYEPQDCDWLEFKKDKTKKCRECGWDGPCDIHKKDPAQGYTRRNMISLCPNCHRLKHLTHTRAEPIISSMNPFCPRTKNLKPRRLA